MKYSNGPCVYVYLMWEEKNRQIIKGNRQTNTHAHIHWRSKTFPDQTQTIKDMSKYRINRIWFKSVNYWYRNCVFIYYSSSPAGSAAEAASVVVFGLAPPPGCRLNFDSNCLRFRSWGWSLSW